MRRPPARLTPLALALVALAGCGNDRTVPPSLAEPARATSREVAEFRDAGLRLALPSNWQRLPGEPPLVVSATSASATVAVWRYPRTEPLPEGDAALQAAGEALLDAARRRDPSLRATRTRATAVDGRPAIDLRARGRVDGRARVLRSVHVFAFGAEVVVDAFAPERQFPTLEREVLRPLLASMELREP